MNSQKPSKVFIGSSTESSRIVDAIVLNLDQRNIQAIPRQVSKKTLGSYFLIDFIEKAEEYDVAVFVFAGDDSLIYQGEEFLAVRDNVIFETGFFVGKLGLSRVFWLTPKGQKIKIPSDLEGIAAGSFDPTQENVEAAVYSFCVQLAQRIQSLPRSQVNYSSHNPGDFVRYTYARSNY